MTLNDWLKAARDELKGVTDECDFEALCMAAEVFGCSNSGVYLKKSEILSEKQLSELRRFTDLRLSGEPLQYVLGRWEFFGNEFTVGRGVLIPRPETEFLVEYALSRFGVNGSPVVYDLCAGTGCVGLSVAKAMPRAKVYLLEKQTKALGYLEANLERSALKNAVIIRGDFFDESCFEGVPPADCVLSNPPYVRRGDIPGLQSEVLCEPAAALDGGADGLDFYKGFARAWKARLSPGCLCAFETGEDQGAKVFDIFSRDFSSVELRRDIYGLQRFVLFEFDSGEMS